LRSTTVSLPLRLGGFALVVLVALGRCSDDSPSETSAAPTPTPAPTVTETFVGTFEQNGTVVHNFDVTNTGDVSVTVTSLQPLSTMQVGVGVGTPDSTLTPPCSLLAKDTNVKVGDVLLSSSLAAGSYCVEILDVGNVFPGVTVGYQLDVTHP
jgi:hypothetical protein